MKFIVTSDFMIKTLSGLLNERETLNIPFYCALLTKNGKPVSFDCFIDLIGNELLIAVTYKLALISSDRIPFQIKSASMRKTFLSSHDITIQFVGGNNIRIIADEKPLFGRFTEQKRNVRAFIAKLPL